MKTYFNNHVHRIDAIVNATGEHGSIFRRCEQDFRSYIESCRWAGTSINVGLAETLLARVSDAYITMIAKAPFDLREPAEDDLAKSLDEVSPSIR